MGDVLDFFKSLMRPSDPCDVCDVFEIEEQRSQCRSDCASNQFGDLRVQCANPWYEVFQDRSKTVCIDGNVFLLQTIVMYLVIIVAFML